MLLPEMLSFEHDLMKVTRRFVLMEKHPLHILVTIPVSQIVPGHC